MIVTCVNVVIATRHASSTRAVAGAGPGRILAPLARVHQHAWLHSLLESGPRERQYFTRFDQAATCTSRQQQAIQAKSTIMIRVRRPTGPYSRRSAGLQVCSSTTQSSAFLLIICVSNSAFVPMIYRGTLSKRFCTILGTSQGTRTWAKKTSRPSLTAKDVESLLRNVDLAEAPDPHIQKVLHRILVAVDAKCMLLVVPTQCIPLLGVLDSEHIPVHDARAAVEGLLHLAAVCVGMLLSEMSTLVALEPRRCRDVLGASITLGDENCTGQGHGSGTLEQSGRACHEPNGRS